MYCTYVVCSVLKISCIRTGQPYHAQEAVCHILSTQPACIATPLHRSCALGVSPTMKLGTLQSTFPVYVNRLTMNSLMVETVSWPSQSAVSITVPETCNQ